MGRRVNWHDDDWLLLMQIYLREPVGVKSPYSRDVVDLGLELHIPPQFLVNKMEKLVALDTPRIERIWNTYSNSPRKLARAVRLLREMKGFGRADEFYEGVEMNETWERDWKPLPDEKRLTPVILILVLDLYFRLTPATMVSETPEVKELAQLVKVSTDEVVEVLDVYQHCDPYLDRRDVTLSPLLVHCQSVWQRYGNGDTEELVELAQHLIEYYR